MFKNAHQTGFLSILYSVGSSPLAIWDQKVKNGHIRRVTDEDVKSLALEISGTNVATTYIVCPADPKKTLGIRLPFFVMIVKNMKKYFTFEIQIMDDKNQSRRFRVSNYQSTTRVRPFCTTMPIGLSSGWNQIQFNLSDFTRRAYGSTYLETMRVQIHANVRIRRIYFSDRLYSEDEMPKEYKLYLPIAEAHKRGKAGKKGVEKDIKEQGTEATKDAAKSADAETIPSGAPPTPTESARDAEKPADEAGSTAATEAPSKVGSAETIPADTAPESAPPAEEGDAAATEPPSEATEALAETTEAPAEESAAADTEQEGAEASTEATEAPAVETTDAEPSAAEAPPTEPTESEAAEPAAAEATEATEEAAPAPE